MSAMTQIERKLTASVAGSAILDRVLEWSAINSGTDNRVGLARMADALTQAFAQLPGEVALVDAAPVERIDAQGRVQPVVCGQHLVVSVRPEAERRVLLTGHMDTVYPADHPFQHCEWLDADTLRGPGTADMKGGLSLMLAGLLALEESGTTIGYDVMINSDEETGSLSSAALIQDLAQGKLAALTYEPALPDGMMARARPGSGNFTATITGRSAHAGRNPQEGRNAVVAAGDLALRLARAVRPGLTVNPARIDGGGPNNVVPDLSIVRFNMRPATPERESEARATIDTLVAAVCAEHDVTIRVHGSFGRPAKPITPTAERLFALVSGAAADLGAPLGWKDTGGVCDGNNIAACGVPVIDTMGARGGAIHSPDEFLVVPSLTERAQLTALVLHRLDREGLPA